MKKIIELYATFDEAREGHSRMGAKAGTVVIASGWFTVTGARPI